MQENPSDKTEQQSKSPWAGMWCLVCSVVCIAPIAPVSWMAGAIAVYFIDGNPKQVGTNAMVVTFLVLASIGFLFLVWGIVIGGKYTLWACAFWAFLAFVFVVCLLL